MALLPKAGAFQVALVVKNPPANAGDVEDAGLIPASGRSPEGGPGNPLQYSYRENPMDRGAWWAAVHGITKSRISCQDISEIDNQIVNTTMRKLIIGGHMYIQTTEGLFTITGQRVK